MNRRGLDELERRRSAVGTIFLWLLVAALLCAAALVVIVVWAALV